MIDETSTKKGHHYATNFMDADTRKLLFTVQGKNQETMGAFAQEMVRPNAHAGQVTALIVDMSTSFIAGARRFFFGARVIFDHFPTRQLVDKAVDAVRKGLVANGADLTGGMWALRGNEWTRSEKQQADRRCFIKAYLILGRAIGLRESLQDIRAEDDAEMLKGGAGGPPAEAQRRRSYERSDRNPQDDRAFCCKSLRLCRSLFNSIFL